MASQIILEGVLLVKGTKISTKTKNPWYFCEVGWMGGKSGFCMLEKEELEKLPEEGSEVRLTFGVRGSERGIQTGKLLKVDIGRAPSARAA